MWSSRNRELFSRNFSESRSFGDKFLGIEDFIENVIEIEIFSREVSEKSFLHHSCYLKYIDWGPQGAIHPKRCHHYLLNVINYFLEQKWFFVCRHVSIWGFQNPVCLSVCLSICPYPEKRNHHSFVNISPTIVIDTSMERSSRVLRHGNPKIGFFFQKSSNFDFWRKAEITLASSISVLH